MKLSAIFAAALPALALAQEESTLTQRATTTLTKTISLASVTVTSTHLNSTAAHTPTLSSKFSSAPAATTSSGPESTGDADNAASVLGAGNLALAGVVGMVVMVVM